MNLPYNPKDKKSILQYAKKLKGKTLREVCELSGVEKSFSGKGKFGQLLEKFYFGYDPNSISAADFFEVGMELKSSPLKQLKNKEFRSKERLVLNIINYFNIVNQEFETSDFYKKNASILLIFYLYQTDFEALDYVIKLVDEWAFPNADLEIIKQDWEFIKNKVKQGKAHELSEGDTFYLGACTKGANASTIRQQPNADIPAKQRAFSFKQGYVNHIIASIAGETKGVYGKLIADIQEIKKKSVEEIVLEKFKPYYGLSIDEIIQKVGVQINPNAKHFQALLTKAILGIELNHEIEEFEKAEIQVKTVRLKENNLPKEDMSFPAFEYTELVNQSWEESDFKNQLEHKFLFVFFKINENDLILDRVKFWNMPHDDLLEAEKVWQKTKEIVENGNIVRKLETNKSGKLIRKTNFPTKDFNKVSHTRPHARDSFDTFPLPTKDKITEQWEYTKHCFWLNSQYIRDEIYLKEENPTK